MVDAVTYHKRYPRFLTPEECQEIIEVIEEYKDVVPRGTFEETGYYGLTQTYDRYNWLHNPALSHLKLDQRLFDLPEFEDWNYMVTQCWGNRLQVGESLSRHYHGAQVPDDIRRNNFYSANIYLLVKIILHGMRIGVILISVGWDIIFFCNLEHEVYTNTGSDIRYSMAIDIYNEYHDNMHNTYMEDNQE